MRGFYHFGTRPRPLHAKRIFGRRRWQFFLPAFLFLAGLPLGAILEESSRMEGQAYTTYFVKKLLAIYGTGSITTVMGVVFLSAFLLHLLSLFFSFSCIGTPVVALIPFAKRFSFGCISGYLYGTMGLRGIIVNLLLFLLPQIGEACLLLAFTAQALQLSSGLFRYLVVQKADSRICTPECVRSFLFTSLSLLGTSLCSGGLATLFAASLL